MMLAACGGSSDSGSEAAASGGSGGGAPAGEAYAGPVGDGEGQLNILAWPGYAEDGSTDPAVDWVTPFEDATGCQVNVKTFGTSDEAVKLMQGGGWDVVSASGDATLRLIYGDNVQPVNTDLVPNYADIFDGLKMQKFNSVDGVAYGIPHGRGANLIMWNTDKVTEPIDSWAPTFEADSPYKGSVTAYDSPIFIADAAVYLMATQPDLGITDPYALDQDQFDAAMKLLEQQKELVGEYWSDYTKAIQAFNSGTSAIGTSWQVIVNLAQADGGKVEATKAKEGATGWSDTWMVAKDTPNLNCAYKWLDWIVSPEVNAQVAEWFGEAPANAKSCALTSQTDFCDVYHAADDAYWQDVYYWNTPTAQCLDGRTDVQCVPYSEWATAWAGLRS
ncbi:MAG: extracellular solute-binding protein [Actinomycetales bacterium]|nr:extracellular solute-binding protein [Actinomycetales bacterium]